MPAISRTIVYLVGVSDDERSLLGKVVVDVRDDLNGNVSLACARRSHHLHQYKQPVSVGMICTNNQLVWV